MSTQQQKDGRFNRASFGLWIVLNMAGFILFGDYHYQEQSGTFDPGDLSLSGALFGFILGAGSGLFIGSFQWIVLRQWIPQARRWIPLSVVGFGLVHFLNDALPYRALSMPLYLMVGGLSVGLCQYIALRHSLSKAILWPLITAVSWTFGFLAAFEAVRILIVQPNPLGALLVFGSIIGLTTGLITGLALKWLSLDSQINLEKTTSPVWVSRWSMLKPAKKILLIGLLVTAAGLFALLAGMMVGLI
jgi:hypothetical protein